MKRKQLNEEEVHQSAKVDSPNKKSKQSSLNQFFSSDSLIKKSSVQKPVLVILPGASGNLSKAFKEALLPKLSQHFEIRIREGKWSNWNLTSKENVQSVLSHCPTSTSDTLPPWYILGHSFGCRMILSMIINGSFVSNPSKLFLTSYPMYNEKGTSERVELLQSLPKGHHILCISGDKDEFLLNSSDRKTKGNAIEIYTEIISSMKCKETVKLEMVSNAGHGLVDLSKKQQAIAVDNIVMWINDFLQ